MDMPGKCSINTPPLSVVHRLPQSYRRAADLAGFHVEPIPAGVQQSENTLIALKLLGPEGENAWAAMFMLSMALSDIDVESSVLECEGEPCLFVGCQDECTATCHLKNVGVVIAETFTASVPC